ncbi:MAG: cellulase family glycosylhydrolase [Chloroflexota bacterium]
MNGYRTFPGTPRWRLRALWWRWFWRGMALWLAAAAVVALLFAGQVAPLYREARNAFVATTGAFAPARAETADLAPIAYTSGNLFGINTFLYQEVEEAKIRKSLALIKAAGFGYVREQVPWQEIERGQKGNFWDERWNSSTWINLDRLVGLVQEYDLQLIARVDYPPDWALPAGTTWHATPPANYDDYGDFLATLTGRYKGRVKYYQVWNEPNLTIEWGMQPVDPAAYVRMLKATYPRIKQADPEAVVIAAALAPNIEQGPLNLSDLTYLQRMYEAGAKDYFDIASVNPYGLRSGPDDRRNTADDTNFSRPVQARAIMVANGDTAKPIWASETGWCAVPPDYPTAPVYGRTTRNQQAAYTRSAYERVQREWPWLGMMSLWHFRMVDNRLASQQSYYFGVVSDDFAPELVYEAMRDLASAPPAVYPGFRQEDNRALAYSGEWHTVADARAALGAYARTDQPGATVSFRFWGTDLDLVAALSRAGSQFEVKVDGTASGANLVERDAAGRAVLNLRTASEEWQVVVPLARNLLPGEHTAEVTLRGGTMALDGVVVQAQARTASPWPLLAGLGAGLSVYVFWVSRKRG